MFCSGLPDLGYIHASTDPADQELLGQVQGVAGEIIEATEELLATDLKSQTVALRSISGKQGLRFSTIRAIRRNAMAVTSSCKDLLQEVVKSPSAEGLYHIPFVVKNILGTIASHELMLRENSSSNMYPDIRHFFIVEVSVLDRAQLDYRAIKPRVRALEKRFINLLEKIAVREKTIIWDRGRNIDAIYQEEVSRDAVYNAPAYKQEWSQIKRYRNLRLQNFHKVDFYKQCIRKVAYQTIERLGYMIAREEAALATICTPRLLDQKRKDPFLKMLLEIRTALEVVLAEDDPCVEKILKTVGRFETRLSPLCTSFSSAPLVRLTPEELAQPVRSYLMEKAKALISSNLPGMSNKIMEGYKEMREYADKLRPIQAELRQHRYLEGLARRKYFEKRARVNPDQMVFHTSRVLDRAGELVTRVAEGKATLLPKHLREILRRVSEQVDAMRKSGLSTDYKKFALRCGFLKQKVEVLHKSINP